MAGAFHIVCASPSPSSYSTIVLCTSKHTLLDHFGRPFKLSSLMMHSIAILVCIASLLVPRAVSAARLSSGVLTQQTAAMHPSLTSDPLKVPDESPAYYCSDPSEDIFQIRSLDFYPTNVRMYVPHQAPNSSFTDTHTCPAATTRPSVSSAPSPPTLATSHGSTSPGVSTGGMSWGLYTIRPCAT